MDIIIAGAGRVGFKLAQILSLKHNIVIIDKNKEALSRLAESIDVMAIYGNIEDPDTYQALMDRSFDIFIAVTDNDEANILSTLIADDTIDVDKKIIRLRNPYFAKSTIAQKLGIYEAVFPFIEAARSIQQLLEFPKAHNVKKFIFTTHSLISVAAQELEVEHIGQIEDARLKVVGIERQKFFYSSKE